MNFRKDQRGSFIFVLVLLLFLLGIIYLVLSQRFSPKPSSRTYTKPAATQLVCERQKSQMSTGNIYKNEQLGISFRPPVGWTISVDCPEKKLAEVAIEAPDSGEEVSPGQIPPHYYRRKFEIDVENRDKTLPINELKEEIKNSTVYNPYDDAKITKITIANDEALKVIDSAAAGVIDIHFSHNSKVYIISHLEFVEGSSVDNPKYTKEFDQLVSSLKFLE